MAMAMIAVAIEGPNAAITMIARINSGKAKRTSMPRIVAVSIPPRRYPAAMPAKPPMINASPTEVNATTIATRIAAITRLS